MQLWQIDIMGGVLLADGRECKLVTGIDDHSRFVVISQLIVDQSARAVCQAFTEAMACYGIPSEVLTDNGKQFTGRFTKPFPVEVMFERICRENGITTRLTKPHSPTMTGKIERFHGTLRRELLDACGAFESLNMATPISLFRPVPGHSTPGPGPQQPPKPPPKRSPERPADFESPRPQTPIPPIPNPITIPPGARSRSTSTW